jgi:hypothetical protein
MRAHQLDCHLCQPQPSHESSQCGILRTNLEGRRGIRELIPSRRPCSEKRADAGGTRWTESRRPRPDSRGLFAGRDHAEQRGRPGSRLGRGSSVCDSVAALTSLIIIIQHSIISRALRCKLKVRNNNTLVNLEKTNEAWVTPIRLCEPGPHPGGRREASGAPGQTSRFR